MNLLKKTAIILSGLNWKLHVAITIKENYSNPYKLILFPITMFVFNINQHDVGESHSNYLSLL